ncbi:MAG: hypothetical protein M1835_005533 [Candelina submexicana]|nr:MAG: hypothetical protein M1835_005533 [Candelina submexicana]
MTEWVKKKYNDNYDYYMPWIEDKYLQWFGENKTSYSTKENLKKTEITGNKDINKIQDSVAEGVGNQFGKGGIGEGIGSTLSKEGFNRAEGEEQDSDKLAKDKAGKATGGGLGGLLGGGGK